jgi:hypothetical protein
MTGSQKIRRLNVKSVNYLGEGSVPSKIVNLFPNFAF